jgi:protein-tyrosine phosphatase
VDTFVGYAFAPAAEDEAFVFGSTAPFGPRPQDGIGREDVNDWIAFMKARGIARVVCLLPDDQIAQWYRPIPEGLIRCYHDEFGAKNVLHEPVNDMSLASYDSLLRVVRFLEAGTAAQRATVVHCLAGIGRTGHVLAAWLAYSRDVEPETAIRQARHGGRDPLEAARSGGATREDLLRLLADIRSSRVGRT